MLHYFCFMFLFLFLIPVECAHMSATDTPSRSAHTTHISADNPKRLYDAVINNDIKTFSNLVDHNVRFSFKDGNGNNALHMIFKTGNQQMLSLLYKKGLLISTNDSFWSGKYRLFAALRGYIDCQTTNKEGQTPLHLAAQYGHSRMISFLTSNFTITINGKDGNGIVPALYALQSGNKETVMLLKDLKADFYVTDNNKKNALHYAAQGGLIDCIEDFLQHYTLNEKDTFNKSPLVYAVESGHRDACKLLLNKGADAYIVDSTTGDTLMHKAIVHKHAHIIELLTPYEGLITHVNNRNTSPLYVAIVLHFNEGVAQLITTQKALVDQTKTNSEAFLKAAYYSKNKEAFIMLLNAGINFSLPINKDITHLVYDNAHHDLLYLLLEKEPALIAQRDSNNKTLLVKAIKNNDESLIKYILKKSPCLKDQSLITTALQENNKPLAAQFIQLGASLNESDKDGQTPLTLALTNKETDIIRQLLEKGANPNTKNRTTSPLHLAIQSNNQEYVDLLLKYGALVQDPQGNPITDSQNQTILDAAIGIKKSSLVKQFATNARLVNRKNNQTGLTPLMHSILNNTPEITRILIAQKADINTLIDDNNSSYYNCNALLIAAHKKNRACLEILLDNHTLDLTRQIPNSLRTIAHFLADYYKEIDPDHLLLKKVLTKNPSLIDAVDYYNQTVLHYALHQKNDRLSNLLLSYNPVIKNRRMVCHAIKYNNNAPLINELLKRGGSINEIDQHGLFALIYATQNQNRALVDFCLQNGASLVSLDPVTGNTPLHIALENKNRDIINLLIHATPHLNIPNKAGLRPLHSAIMNNLIQAGELLLQKNAPLYEPVGNTCIIDSQGLPYLHFAIKHNKKDFIPLLVKNSILANAYDTHGNTPLTYAITVAHIDNHEIVGLLLAHNIPINSKNRQGFTPLSVAVQCNKPNLVDLLLTHHASCNELSSDGRNALMHAILEKNDALALKLIPHTLLTTRDKTGNNVLHLAIQTKNNALVHELSSCKLLLDNKNNEGTTPFLMATAQADIPILEKLKNAGANILITNNQWQSAAHIAAMHGHTTVVEYLLKNGFDVNQPDSNGNTPLFVAASHNRADMVQLLIDLKGSVYTCNNQGKNIINSMHTFNNVTQHIIKKWQEKQIQIAQHIRTTQDSLEKLRHENVESITQLQQKAQFNYTAPTLKAYAGFNHGVLANNLNNKEIHELESILNEYKKQERYENDYQSYLLKEHKLLTERIKKQEPSAPAIEEEKKENKEKSSKTCIICMEKKENVMSCNQLDPRLCGYQKNKSVCSTCVDAWCKKQNVNKKNPYCS